MGIAGNIVLVSSFIMAILCLVMLKVGKNSSSGLKAGMLSAVLILVSACVLFFLLVSSDFSIEYVFKNTDRNLPLIYKISAFWSGAAGSLLLWATCNSIVFFVIYRLFNGKKNNNQKYLTYLTATTTIFNLAFLFVLIFVSNPFKSVGLSSDGFGLNPSLQSLGMVYHPPLIMFAYSCIFAALASIVYEVMNPDRPKILVTRNLTLLSWIMLTTGIVSGGLWAYSELGWGGYWSWDPIENSALATWLLLTACLHMFSLRKNNTISDRPLFIIIAATVFSVLFGTFMARSGIINSVHAYSNQASIVFFGIILALLILVSVSIFIAVFRKNKAPGQQKFEFSRWLKCLPAILLVVSAVVLTLLTISPLFPLKDFVVTEMMYDFVFGILGLLAMLASTAFFALKQTTKKMKLIVIVPSLVIGIMTLFLPAFASYMLLTRIALTVSVMCVAAVLVSFMTNLNKLSSNSKYFAVFVIHLSIVVIAIGLIGSRGMKVETSSVLTGGDKIMIGSHELTLISTAVNDGAQIKTWTANLSYHDGKTETDMVTSLQLYKEKNIYHSKAYIVSSFREDLYIIVENADDDGVVLLKVSLIKWISLLWVGIIMLILPSLLLCWKRLCGNTYYI